MFAFAFFFANNVKFKYINLQTNSKYFLNYVNRSVTHDRLLFESEILYIVCFCIGDHAVQQNPLAGIKYSETLPVNDKAK